MISYNRRPKNCKARRLNHTLEESAMSLKFNVRKQQEGEPVDSFVTDLYSLAEHCAYRDLHNEMIRDHLVVDITSL